MPPPAFEQHVGQIESIEARRYSYLLDLPRQLAGQTTPCVRLRPAEGIGRFKTLRRTSSEN